jgi:hypothetical protein
MKLKDHIYSLVILALLFVILLQKCGDSPEPPAKPKIDTVIQYIEVHDTVKGKTKFVKGKPDTLWMDSLVYRPDTLYPKLLQQYKELGYKHFSTNIFRSEFILGEYGKATVTDSVNHNMLIGSSMSYNIKVPEKTITITKPEDPKRQVYVGFGAYGNKRNFVDGVYVAGMYKDKQDRLTGVSVGYQNNQVQFGLSSFWKLKLK